MTDYQRVNYAQLCERVSCCLQAAGVPQERADIEATIMAEADLLEVPSHGVRMLPNLITALNEGRAAHVALLVFVLLMRYRLWRFGA